MDDEEMKLPQPLISGTLVQRYKRFLADIKLDSGQLVTAHCPNSGSMKSFNEPGSPVLLSVSRNPKRKLPYTWEMIRVNNIWVGINTNHPNKLVREGIEQNVISELQGYDIIRSEVNYGNRSRIDLLLEGSKGRCYIEIKNVTLVEGERALFPDAVTLRGQKHLKELMGVVSDGWRAVIFFVVQRGDGELVSPADEIDPEYGRLLRQAAARGVELLAYQAAVLPEEIKISHRVPVVLD
ncbi:MAG: DNA/RNA nuclease SfsA [Calditrichia bacterium]